MESAREKPPVSNADGGKKKIFRSMGAFLSRHKPKLFWESLPEANLPPKKPQSITLTYRNYADVFAVSPANRQGTSDLSEDFFKLVESVRLRNSHPLAIEMRFTEEPKRDMKMERQDTEPVQAELRGGFGRACRAGK
ncbi:MAG: hypothetical protein WCT52_00795 [Candidatus Micrarchaeia archaeon]